MADLDLQIFVAGAQHYFNQIGAEAVSVGTPYLIEAREKIIYDYTGVIGISGRYRGCVCFTAPRVLLRHVLLALGEPDMSAENYSDLSGEIANTISGNARTHLGTEFVISTPVIIEGAPERVQLPENLRSFVVPVRWKHYAAALLIGVQPSAVAA